MHFATVYIDPKGVAPVGFAQAAGLPGDIKFDFKTQGNIAYPGIVDLYPQLVLKPFTQPMMFAYDIVINDPTGSSGIATIPGNVINERCNVEVYTRNMLGQPQRMIAAGRVDLSGNAYIASGPLGPASYPQGPAGPTGPQGATGATGVRGSRWYTGLGPPLTSPVDGVDGDMYLDESNGDVWRWSDTSRAWSRFRGV